MLALVFLLAGCLLPTLFQLSEKGRRVTCRNNLKVFYQVLQAYAHDHDGRLPSGVRDDLDQSTAFISTKTRKVLVQYAGGQERFLVCPNMNHPAVWGTNGGYYVEKSGFALGYFYLGGHTDTPWGAYRDNPLWYSPDKITDDPSWVLTADSTTWSTVQKWTFVPHGHWGPVLLGKPINNLPGGITAKEAGLSGCNVNYLNGAVLWRPAAGMKAYIDSGFGESYIGTW